MKTIISSIATHLPEKVITNYDLEESLDTSNEWIVRRTGIEERHVVSDGELASDLGVKAAVKAIAQAGISASEIDAVVVSTTTADRRFPSCASKIQGEIGAMNAFAFDINAACAGFIYNLAISDSLMKGMKLKNILLVTCETLSLFVDWSDRATCVLFGDGAGAIVLQSADDSCESGIIATDLYSDGSKEMYESILAHNGPHNGHRGFTTASGRFVFKCAIECMASAMNSILEKNGMTLDDIDWIVPHQANSRILETLCRMNGFPSEKMIVTIRGHANTSSSSIPLALKAAIDDGRIKKGDTLLLAALGAGIVWGSAILKI
jgi:3-oxoacyl-[acyl-carrier-protein] synthase-3